MVGRSTRKIVATQAWRAPGSDERPDQGSSMFDSDHEVADALGGQSRDGGTVSFAAAVCEDDKAAIFGDVRNGVADSAMGEPRLVQPCGNALGERACAPHVDGASWG